MEREQEIVDQLRALNAQAVCQNSLSRMLVIGIIYGIGFFIGSAIIATIALGILGPWFAEIPWVRNAFETGIAILRPE